MSNKPASILLEIIFSILLLSIVSTAALLIYKDFFEIHQNEYHNELSNIELLNTKYFLQQNITHQTLLNDLTFKDNTLYFKNTILLQEVTTFETNIKGTKTYIKICVQNRRCKGFYIG